MNIIKTKSKFSHTWQILLPRQGNEKLDEEIKES
jgi:hypothetical protein